MSVADKVNILPTPPRQRNPYIIDHGYSQRNVSILNAVNGISNHENNHIGWKFAIHRRGTP